jgi:CRISPR/Cas system CSM-associated protein Csm4 (group 5 of RAMP superfamily)
MINLPIFLIQKHKLMNKYIETQFYMRIYSTLNLFKATLFRPQYRELEDSKSKSQIQKPQDVKRIHHLFVNKWEDVN